MIKIDDTPVIFIPFMDRCHDKYFFKTHNSDSNDPEGGGGGGGGTPIWKRRGCSSEILNLTPKRDQSGCDRTLCRPLKE